MRRSRLPEFLGAKLGLKSPLLVFALILTVRLSGEAWAEPNGRGPEAPHVARSGAHAGFEELDQKLQEVVRRASAKLIRSPATPEALAALDGMILVGPRQAVPASGLPATLGPEGSKSAAKINDGAGAPQANASQGVEGVFGDMLIELSSPSGSIMREAEPRVAERPNPSDAATSLVAPAAPVVPPHVAPLDALIDQCLQSHVQQRLNSGQDSCWSIMHSFLGWGPACEIQIGSSRGNRTNAMAWVAQNQPCGGRRLFYLDGNRIRGREGPGYQGHPAQFLAMLAQCDVDSSYPLKVNDRNFTVADLIAEEQRTCYTGLEMTFKLISLVHYLGTEATWKNDRGESWDIPKILAIELAQPINGAACGGTHRMMAISYGVAKRREEGRVVDGHWWRAEKYVADYHEYALTLQNRDGSFSSDWFRQRADWGDVNRRVQTTGHILEWLAYSMPQDALHDPRVVNAVHYLTRTMTQHRYQPWEVGPKGHAIRALRLYQQRVFEPSESQETTVAQRGEGGAPQR